MPPLNEIDPLLLLALALSAKRRPATLIEIVAAADLVAGTVPAEIRLVAAFARLAAQGLICARDGGFALTPVGEGLVAGGRRRADSEQRLQGVRDKLVAHLALDTTPAEPAAPLTLTAKEVCAAIIAHRASSLGTEKNLLVAKPKAVDPGATRPGQRQRKPLPARRRPS